jgi:hypothetical protein
LVGWADQLFSKEIGMASESNELAAVVELGAEQRAALELLCGGKSVAEAARTAGVARLTIYRWLKNDAVFRAAYHEWHEELGESCRSRLAAMTDKAATAVEKALEAGDARAAMQLLKGLGMMKPSKRLETDPEVIRRRMAVEARRKQSKLEEAERGVELKDAQARALDKEARDLVEGFGGEGWEIRERRMEGGKISGKWVRKGAVGGEGVTR